ncbi:MAG: hypothetical protein KTR26_01450 [Flammeovirgaceae bacterium]|nr:hypothetical protein [Flammeovirgaceae bacterium]
MLIIVLLITGPISISQSILSGISLIYKWDDEIKYSYDSAYRNKDVSDELQDIAKFPPENFDELKKKYDLCIKKLSVIDQMDEERNITEKERRMGLRYGLKYFGRRCEECKTIPISMNSSLCPKCGNF